MDHSRLPLCFSLSLTVWGLGACVSSGTHQAVLDALSKTKKELEAVRADREDLEKKGKQCNGDLTVALDQNQQLAAKVAVMDKSVEQLQGEKGALVNERQALSSEVEELKKLRAAAEARDADYKKLLDKLHRMIDAGTLEVKIRNGRMLVRMPSDVVFSSGSSTIKAEAVKAITDLAQTIREFKDRKFLVVGHSDATPIRSERFPSNWELSAQRAVEVVKLMITAGVPPQILSAAGQAEFEPLVEEDTPEHKAVNRRVELVFMPTIDELPGFGEAGNKAAPAQ
jgi:chemotaxis protein MotB